MDNQLHGPEALKVASDGAPVLLVQDAERLVFAVVGRHVAVRRMWFGIVPGLQRVFQVEWQNGA